MDELTVLNRIWKYPDRLETELEGALSEYQEALEDEIQAILDRYQRISLAGKATKREVERLHREIERWWERGYADAAPLRLYMDDLENRSRIDSKEILFVLLFASYVGFYRRAAEVSAKSFYQAAMNTYRKEFAEAQKVTGGGSRNIPTRKAVDQLLFEQQPWGESFYEGLYNDAQYRARTLANMAQAQKQNEDIILDLAGVPFDKAMRAQENWMLRKTPAGHAGYVDMTMSFIVGHTVAQAFIDAGVKKYQFVATIDDRTTEACKALNLQVFDMKELKLGINAPPVYPPPHPCRSVIRAVE